MASETEAARLVVCPPSAPAYTSTEEGTMHKPPHTGKEKGMNYVCRRTLHHVHTRLTQLQGFLCVILLLLLVVLAVILLVVTWELTYSPVTRAFQDAHEVHVQYIKASCDVVALSLVRVVTVLASLWVSTPTVLNPANMSEWELCNVVDNAFANDAYVRGIVYLSQSLDEGRICYQSYDPSTGLRILSETHTANGSYVGGAYLVDSDTHRFHQPPIEMFPIPPNALNVTQYFAQNPGIRQLIDEGTSFREGDLDVMSRFLMWEATGAKPTQYFYTSPVAAYDTPEAAATREPDGRDILQGRLDLQYVLTNMSFSEASRAMLLDARGLRDGDMDPYLVSATWMARVTDDTDVWSHRNISSFHYTRVSDITDGVMLAGLKHVKMGDFKNNAFDKTKTFWYRGAQSIVTWGNYTTDDGLSLSYVIVDTAGPVRGFPLLKAAAIVCCTVFLVIALPVLFAAVVDVLFGRSMRTVARSLTRAGELGNKKARRHIRDDARIVIVEVDELVDAHNEAVDILRAVEAYLPPALFGDGEWTDTLDVSLSGTGGSSTTAHGAANASASFFESIASTVAHRRGEHGVTVLAEMRVTVVTLHPVARPDTPGHRVARDGDRLSADDKDDRPAACGLEALRVLDRETYNAPTPAFHSRWAVQDYAAVVLQAAEQRHGTVLRLAPELTVVCFGGTMEALTRGSADAAALAPTLEGKACATDALAAVQFAQDVRSRLQQLAARDSTNVPDVVAVVETSAYHVGVCRVAKLQQSMSVAVGASLAQMCAPPRKMAGGCALATTTTAQLLMHRLRFVPRCVLHVCSRHAGHVMYTTEVVHQILDGHADTLAWRAQCSLLHKAYKATYASEYGRALTYLQRMPAAARGDMSLMSGERLGALMRAAADSGVASAQLYGTVQNTLLEKLVRYCEVHLRHPQRANTVLTPSSYLDAVARCLPPLPTLDGTLWEASDATLSPKHSGTPHVSVPPGLFVTPAHRALPICLHEPHAPLKVLKGVRDLSWYLPDAAEGRSIRFGSAGSSILRPRQANVLVLSTTGAISLADELMLHDPNHPPSTEQLRCFTQIPESPYLITVEDILVEQHADRHLVVYEFISSPTVEAFRSIFTHQVAPSLTYRHIFSACCALATLDAAGLCHPQFTPASILLMPLGVSKVKVLSVKPCQYHEYFQTSLNMYVSPEEAAGEYPTIVSNVYSNAVMAIEFLTRRLPYRWTAVAAADRVEAELTALQEHCGLEFAAALVGGLIEVVDIPAELDMPESMRNILHLCLQRDPALRPRPRDVLRLYRADPYLGPLVSDLPSGPWER